MHLVCAIIACKNCRTYNNLLSCNNHAAYGYSVSCKSISILHNVNKLSTSKNGPKTSVHTSARFSKSNITNAVAVVQW